MNIESRLGIKSVNEIIEYFGKDNFKINYSKYRFVLTDEEIYVLSEFIRCYLEQKEFLYDKIANELFYDMDLTKAKPDNIIVARLLIIAYKKIKHVDSFFTNEEQMKNRTLLNAMSIKSNDNSISLDTYNKFANDGTLHASTSRLERFIVKYRIGMMHAYMKLSLPGDLNLDFYQDLATFCHQLGYTNKHISPYQIDNILLNVNAYLGKISAFVEGNNVINEIDLAIASIDEKLKEINMHFKNQTEIPNFRMYMDEINEKLAYITEISRPYIVNEIESERRFGN